MPGRRMLNVYGPTEATVNATAASCSAGQPITIGRPLAAYEIIVLDDELHPRAARRSGELYIGGPGIARGYLNQPELTAQAFVRARLVHRPAPLSHRRPRAASTRRASSSFSGRLDSQVKVRGYRVELAEIEAVLLEQTRRSAAPSSRHGGRRRTCRRLAAYVVLDVSAARLDRNRVLAPCGHGCPPTWCRPSSTSLPELPLLASGKVDRKRLPHPWRRWLRKRPMPPTPPATALEARIAAVWANLSATPRRSRQDFFLDLGGHSLLAAQLVALLRTRTGSRGARRLFPSHRARARRPRRGPHGATAIADAAPAPRTLPASVTPVARKPGWRLIAAQTAICSA